MTALAPPQGRRPTIEWVPIGELLVDPTYQRSVEAPSSRRHIAAIAAAWDWDLADVLKVSRRPDDQLFVVDGQHRRAAAVARGDIPDLPCVIKRCASVSEEARLFVAANRQRKKMDTLDDFNAAIAAGDEEAVTIAGLVHDAGLKIARHKVAKNFGPSELGYLTGLRTALRTHGKPVLSAALTAVGEAFPDEVLSNAGALVGGLVLIYANPPADFDPDAFFEALLGGTTLEWSERARLGLIRGGKARCEAVRGVMLASYAVSAGKALA